MDSAQAKNKICPIFTHQSLCAGENCMGWRTNEKIVRTKEIADEVFVDAYLVHAGPEDIHDAQNGQIGIWTGIKNGILLIGKMKEPAETFRQISHEEIMAVDSKGQREWLEKIKNRKPAGKDLELKNPRNIQYDTEMQKFYWVYDVPVTEHHGHCSMIK